MRATANRQHERGQILVMVAGGALTLLLLLGLVLDVGVAFFNRREGQNVADLMSVSGAKFVADEARNLDPPGRTFGTLDRIARDNGCRSNAAVPCRWTAWFVRPGSGGPRDGSQIRSGSGVPGSAIGVRVEVVREPRTFIIGLANLQKWDVRTQATAIAERPEGAPANLVLPIAIRPPNSGGDDDDDDDSGGSAAFRTGQVYDFSLGKDSPYRFGFLSWRGGSLLASLCTPDNPTLAIGDSYPNDPGTLDSVRSCLNEWIASGQPVLLPIAEVTVGGGGATWEIVGFGAFVFTTDQPVAVDSIRGYFVESYPYVNPAAGSGDQPDETDMTYYIGLVK